MPPGPAGAIAESLEVDPVCQAFSCLDVRTFPENEKDLAGYGNEDLLRLIGWYGAGKQALSPDSLNNQVIMADPKVDPVGTKEEYSTYKALAVSLNEENEKNKRKKVTALEGELKKIKQARHVSRDKRKVSKIEKEIRDTRGKEITLVEMYNLLKKKEYSTTMPNIKTLLLFANLSSVGNAVVERLFSLMKLTKTGLRNRIGDQNIDMLLRLNKEAPEKWSEDQKEDLVDLWIRKKEEKGVNARLKL